MYDQGVSPSAASTSRMTRRWRGNATGWFAEVQYAGCSDSLFGQLLVQLLPAVLPSAVRQELSSAIVLLVPVDPMVMASDASLTGGAICTVRCLAASRPAHSQQTSEDEAVLICVNDNLGAGRRAMELLHLGVAALAWIGTDPHAERVCRHAWPDVLVPNEGEEPQAAAVLSLRAGHPFVQGMVNFAGRSMSRNGSLKY